MSQLDKPLLYGTQSLVVDTRRGLVQEEELRHGLQRLGEEYSLEFKLEGITTSQDFEPDEQTSVQYSFRIKNTGTAPLTVSGLSVATSEFSVLPTIPEHSIQLFNCLSSSF